MDQLELKKTDLYREMLAEHRDVAPDCVELAVRFMQIAARRSLRLEGLFMKYGLTPGRFWLLMILRREESKRLSPSALAERCGVTRSTMTQFLDGLEKEGLVRRVDNSEDRRALLIELTPKAESLLKKVIPEHLKRMSQFTKVLTKAERVQLVGLLEKLGCAMQGLDSDET